MATILQLKPIEQDAKLEMLKFFGIMREKKEYEMLQAMKAASDAKYKIKSFKRQLREIEKNITKLKNGKPIPVPQAKPKPPATEVAKPKPVELHSYYTETAQYTPSLFLKSSVFHNNFSEKRTFNHEWKCEKCNDLQFPNRKLLKVHISEIHAY